MEYSKKGAHDRLWMIHSHLREVDHKKLIDLFPMMNRSDRMKYNTDFQCTSSKPSKVSGNSGTSINNRTANLRFPLNGTTIPIDEIKPNPCLYNRYNFYEHSKLVPTRIAKSNKNRNFDFEFLNNQNSTTLDSCIAFITSILDLEQDPLVINFNKSAIYHDAFMLNVNEGDYNINGLMKLLEDQFFNKIFITIDEITETFLETIDIIKEVTPSSRIILLGPGNQEDLKQDQDSEQDQLSLSEFCQQFQRGLEKLHVNIDAIFIDNTLGVNSNTINSDFSALLSKLDSSGDMTYFKFQI